MPSPLLTTTHRSDPAFDASLGSSQEKAAVGQAQVALDVLPRRLVGRTPVLVASVATVLLGPVLASQISPDMRLALLPFVGFALVLAGLSNSAWVSRTLLGGLLVAGAVSVVEIRSGIPAETSLRALGVVTAALLFGYMLARRMVLYRSRQRRLLDLAAEQLELLRSHAMHDELTGVFNRRQLMQILARQKALADRGALDVALVFADLDHFKQVNDRYGHVVGDNALQAFAKVAEDVVRSEDFVARFGGEEFVLVLVNTDEHFAAVVAERLAERTRELAVPAGADTLRLTVSCGVTQFRPGESVDALLRRADAAMYSAKTAGRDRVVAAVG